MSFRDIPIGDRPSGDRRTWHRAGDRRRRCRPGPDEWRTIARPLRADRRMTIVPIHRRGMWGEDDPAVGTVRPWCRRATATASLTSERTIGRGSRATKPISRPLTRLRHAATVPRTKPGSPARPRAGDHPGRAAGVGRPAGGLQRLLRHGGSGAWKDTGLRGWAARRPCMTRPMTIRREDNGPGPVGPGRLPAGSEIP